MKPTQDEIKTARSMANMCAQIAASISVKHRDPRSDAYHEELKARWVPQWAKFQDYCVAHYITKHMI